MRSGAEGPNQSIRSHLREKQESPQRKKVAVRTLAVSNGPRNHDLLQTDTSVLVGALKAARILVVLIGVDKVACFAGKDHLIAKSHGGKSKAAGSALKATSFAAYSRPRPTL